MKLKTAALLLVTLACFAANSIAGFLDREIAFSETDIQASLTKSGPQEKNYGGLISVSMIDPPRITLGTPEGKIGIAARVYVTLLGNAPVPVIATGTAGIRYDDNAKAFFLENPLAQSVESPALPKEAEPSARRTVNALIASYFRTKPIYVLRENGSPQETAARWLLRSIRIEPGQLVATLSAF